MDLYIIFIPYLFHPIHVLYIASVVKAYHNWQRFSKQTMPVYNYEWVSPLLHRLFAQ